VLAHYGAGIKLLISGSQVRVLVRPPTADGAKPLVVD
jgi:hypothetical protein